MILATLQPLDSDIKGQFQVIIPLPTLATRLSHVFDLECIVCDTRDLSGVY